MLHRSSLLTSQTDNWSKADTVETSFANISAKICIEGKNRFGTCLASHVRVKLESLFVHQNRLWVIIVRHHVEKNRLLRSQNPSLWSRRGFSSLSIDSRHRETRWLLPRCQSISHFCFFRHPSPFQLRIRWHVVATDLEISISRCNRF